MTLPGRTRRRLTGIEGTLAADARLASLFEMFNALNRGEPASGPEPLPRFGWSRGPWLPRVAALVVMVAVIVGGLLLSAATRPAVRSCQALIATGGRVAVPLTDRGLLCHAYPANK